MNKQELIKRFLQKKSKELTIYASTTPLSLEEKESNDVEDKNNKSLESDSEEESKEESDKSDSEVESKSISKKDRYINLQVQLDSWSPIYEQNGFKYREKIDLSAFDDETNPIEKQELYSYVDHDISIEKMIGSTNNKSMSVFKKDKTIYASIKVNENDYLAKKTADLIESKAVTSNSFIFQAKKIEHKIYENNEDLDLEIIYKKGQLLSIDPVYKGFFNQCKSDIEYKGDSLMQETKNVETLIENEKVEIKEPTTNVTQKEQPSIEIEDIVNKRIEMNMSVLSNTISNLNKKEEKKEIHFKDVRSKWLNRELLTKEENEVLYKDIIDIKKWSEENKDTSILKSLDLSLSGDINKIFNVSNLVEKVLDGTSKQNGLALIEVLTSKYIISEWSSVFPELTEFATILPIIGLNKVNQPVLIPDKTKVTKLDEGAKSVRQGGKTTNVQFQPDRYSIELVENNQLNAFGPVLEKQTETIKDNIRLTLREEFYKNLFKNVGSALNMDTYDGGATSESVRETEQSGQLSLRDLDIICGELFAKWGHGATEGYVISMHADILKHLEDEYFRTGNTLWKDLYNPINRTFRGIRIVVHNFDTVDKTVEAGKNVVAFWLKSAVVAYGCSIITQDAPLHLVSEDFYTRYIRTRGQIKMCDPHLNTRVIQIKA